MEVITDHVLRREAHGEHRRMFTPSSLSAIRNATIQTMTEMERATAADSVLDHSASWSGFSSRIFGTRERNEPLEHTLEYEQDHQRA